MRQRVMNKGVVAFLVVVIAVCGAIAWDLFERTGELASDVELVERRADGLSNTLAKVNDQASLSLNAIEAAEALQRQALDEASEQSRQAMQAEQDRASAQAAQDRATHTAARAQAAKIAAEQGAEEYRRNRREEWQRLGAALKKIAPTTTGDWLYDVALERLRVGGEGNLDRPSRELLSRLAGVLLANYGYSVELAGSNAALVQTYLREAGLPQAAIALASRTGATVLEVSDTVLD
jgi:hypothetical protein